MPTDLLPDASVSPAGVADATAASSDTTDYKSKYTGLNTAHSKALERERTLQKQMSDQAAEYEEQIAALTSKQKPASEREKELLKRATDAEAAAQQLTSELTLTKAEKAVRKIVQEKFPNLIPDWDEGLLRERKDFDTDDAFTTYLEKASKRLGTAVAAANQSEAAPDEAPASDTVISGDRRTVLGSSAMTMPAIAGTLPPVATLGGHERSTGKRTPPQIQKDMMATDTRTKEGFAKMQALNDEMDLALMA